MMVRVISLNKSFLFLQRKKEWGEVTGKRKKVISGLNPTSVKIDTGDIRAQEAR